MSDYWSAVTISLRCCVEILIAFFIFCGKLEKRKAFIPVSAGFAALALAVCFLISFAYAPQKEWVITIQISAIFLITQLWIFFAYKVNFSGALVYTMLVLFLRNTGMCAFNFCKCTLGRIPAFEDACFGTGILNLLANYFIFAVAYILIGVFIGKKISRYDDIGKEVKSFLALLISMVCILPLLSATDGMIEEFGTIKAMMSVISIIYSVMMITTVYMLLSRIQLQRDAAILKRTQEMESKYYEQLKESMEAISLKSHDLKYQLRRLRESNSGSTEFLNEAERALDVYDSIYKTGNKTLDIILSDRAIKCSAKEIDFTCIANAEKLNFMYECDIYSLFCNAIDNAMEYEESVVNLDDRFIHLSVKERDGFLFIHIENYYEGEDIENNKLPSTTKNDKTSHGFGLKSIANIVKKYGGQYTINATEGLFELNIIFTI